LESVASPVSLKKNKAWSAVRSTIG